MDRKERIEKLIKRVRDEWVELWKEGASQYVYLHQLPAAKELEKMGCELIDAAGKNYYGDVAAIVCPNDGLVYAFAPNLGEGTSIDNSVEVYRIKVEKMGSTNEYISPYNVPEWLGDVVNTAIGRKEEK